MPVEEIGIGILGAIARFVGWFIMDIIFDVICWGVGWAVLRLFTLGKYPQKDSNPVNVATVGAIVLLTPVIGFTIDAS
ncbi:MAG: hypothetical protein V3T17_00390 [Pseudomonadales bacterium]